MQLIFKISICSLISHCSDLILPLLLLFIFSFMTFLCLQKMVKNQSTNFFDYFCYYNEHCSFDYRFCEKVEQLPFPIRDLTIFQGYFGTRDAIDGANSEKSTSYYQLKTILAFEHDQFFLIFFLKSIFRIDLRQEVVGNENFLLFSLHPFQFALYRTSLEDDCLSLGLKLLEQNSQLKLLQFAHFLPSSFGYSFQVCGQKLKMATREGVKVFVSVEIQ